MNRKSKRFTPTRWTEWVVPAVLVLLGVVLFATVLIVVLSMIGLTPAM